MIYLERIIPAWAGNAVSCSLRASFHSLESDHPRVGGETLRGWRSYRNVRDSGSSPRGRGTL